ncbi:hypothetical protein JTE90_014122 [Oedothorax gibbosus]|uniref:Uncharacterized protein n=1 Tax=Oedothorax gibbosus TaxID=931172 RepID=A0AAV6U5J9_9ARAC|nr:hypothetical protein JTE90_014122 [Oedothorax gibbosus]
MQLEVFLLLTAVLTASSLFVCPEDYCDNIQCEDVSCGPNQEINPYGTFCGCCPACVTLLEKGDKCPIPIFNGGPPPTVKCRNGCDYETKTCK